MWFMVSVYAHVLSWHACLHMCVYGYVWPTLSRGDEYEEFSTLMAFSTDQMTLLEVLTASIWNCTAPFTKGMLIKCQSS